MIWCRYPLLVVIVAVLAACGEQAGDGPRGGREGLPGRVPAGVRFAPEDKAAPKAPDFDVTLLDSTKVSARRLWAERPVILVFFTSWCRNCAAQQETLNDLARENQDLVAFIGIVTQDEKASVVAYLREHDVRYAVAIDKDGSVWRSYAVAEPPLVAVVSKGGRLTRGWPGGTTKAKLREALGKLVIRRG